MRDSEPIETFYRVLDAFTATVRDVIARERHRRKACPLESIQILGWRSGSGHVARQLYPTTGMRNLKMPDRDVR
jgi:hypothetical protein